jgi:thymidylate synthase
VLSGSDAPWIFGYNERLRRYADSGVLRGAYGPRLRRWDGRVDQLHRVVEILRGDPQSRRAVIQLHDPARDAPEHRDVPCTLRCCFWLRAGRLDMLTSMRSQDAWTGLPYDLFVFTIVHELVAGWLDAELGDYRHHVGSLHLYDSDLDSAAGTAAAGAARPVSGQVMAELTTPLAGLDDLLGRVRAGVVTGHPGWDVMGQTMHSYRLWKSRARGQARDAARALPAPLGPALAEWYAELDRQAGATGPS